jgi:hypothetical protein
MIHSFPLELVPLTSFSVHRDLTEGSARQLQDFSNELLRSALEPAESDTDRPIVSFTPAEEPISHRLTIFSHKQIAEETYRDMLAEKPSRLLVATILDALNKPEDNRGTALTPSALYFGQEKGQNTTFGYTFRKSPAAMAAFERIYSALRPYVAGALLTTPPNVEIGTLVGGKTERRAARRLLEACFETFSLPFAPNPDIKERQVIPLICPRNLQFGPITAEGSLFDDVFSR